MARKAPDPSARIALLKAARDNLRKAKIKGPVNADELAKIVGMTWRQLKTYVEPDPDFPCLMRGSEGVAYQFDPKAALDYLIKRFERELEARKQRNKRIAQMAGFPEEMADTGLSLEDLRLLDQLQVNAQRRKIEQGLYVTAAEHEAAVTDLLTTMREETLSAVGRLDPSGKWPAVIRNQVREELRSILVRVHDKLGEHFNPDVQTARAGSGRTRAARR